MVHLTESTTTSRTVAIIGSTGNQGSSVLKSLLETSHPILALTRSTSKLDAHTASHPTQLTAVKTDITDPTSLRLALQGVFALFVNTFSDYTKPDGTEEALLRSIVDAAAQSGVQYLIMSVLPEGMPARAYIAKSRAMNYAREVFERTSIKPIFVQMGWYMSGFSGYMRPVVNAEDGVVEFRWSTIDDETLFPLVDVADLGPVVKAILANPDRWVGVEIPVVGDVLTIPQVAEAYSEITGQPARAVFVEHVEQEKIPQWIARHRGYKEAGYFPKYIGREEDIPVLARQLYPGIKSFRQWLRETGFDATRV